MAGNAPFTEVVITPDRTNGPGTDYQVVGAAGKDLLKGHQGRRVTVEGVPCPPTSPMFARGIRPTRILRVEGR